MNTKEMIGYLESLRDYKDELAWELRGKMDRKEVIAAIIETLKEYNKLMKEKKLTLEWEEVIES